MVSIKLPAKKDLDSAYNVVAEYISHEYGPQSVNQDQIHAITHAAFRDLQQKGVSLKKWKKGCTPDADQKEKLITAVNTVLVSGKTPWEPKLDLESKNQKLIFDIMRGNIPSLQKLMDEPSLIRAVVWKKNPEILKEARDLLGKIFVDMFEELNHKTLSDKDSFHMEMIIGDLLSLYPFLSPKNGEELKVPLRVNGVWQLGSYSVEKIKLTPKWMGSPLVAIGLIPKDKRDFPALLLFKGTTYPTDSGFNLSVLTDINPGASVGSYAFKIGKKKIEEWLDVHTGESKAIVFGKSLGGAQAWRTATYYPNQVEKVMAYGAPGLSLKDVKRWNQVLKNGSHYPEVNLFCQKGDRVPYFDRAVRKGFNYFQVVGNKSRKGFLAHAEMYSTHESSIIIQMDHSKIAKKWRRLTLTALKGLLSLSLFPYLILRHAVFTTAKKLVHLKDRYHIKKIDSSGI